ncbi:CBS domain-containing protein [Psychromonas sp. 14N.309.X.WAT.B.A12]|uniref:CBS domain-containing protein n=1 Tax=unclassified Psychromonas TaxID=2614957 RepID=UPI0025B16288|nr:CBS domain-containing protein [Psychromonas sp. 14N.309.X.WAT.B.A12]MDN2662814.1 CBS domain-containing protein [Psychromonas sp. 14N.309.X.WAT.B.A12]
MGMKVVEAMTSRVVTVTMDDRIPVLQNILSQAGFHHLLVVEEGKLQGVISDRDVLRVLSPFLDTEAELMRDLNTAQRPAHQVMTRSPVTVAPDTSVKDALTLMLTHDISCLPVLDQDEILGIFTIHDGVRALIR